jgi:hypothetical protein
MWGIIALLVISVIFVIYMSVAPASTNTEVVYQDSNQTDKPALLKDNNNHVGGDTRGGPGENDGY